MKYHPDATLVQKHRATSHCSG